MNENTLTVEDILGHTHVLTIDELPGHNHSLQYYDVNPYYYETSNIEDVISRLLRGRRISQVEYDRILYMLNISLDKRVEEKPYQFLTEKDMII